MKRIFVVVLVTNLLILTTPAAQARQNCLDYSNEDLHHRSGVPARRFIQACHRDDPPRLPSNPPHPPSNPPSVPSNPPSEPSNPPSEPSNPPSTRSNGTTLTYFTSDGSSLVDKPVLLVEGYDPLNLIDANVYYELLPGDFKQWLEGTGRDLVIMNFDDYSRDMKVLANQFQSGLATLNARKAGNHPTAVVGYSAGGLIARWGLKTMENQGIDHDVSIYISYDAPHRGATVPYGIIDGVRDLKDKIPGFIEPRELKTLWNLLNSKVSSQLLIGRGSNFLREIENLGYPDKLARFAVANGSNIGTHINLPPGELVFDYKAHLGPFDNEYQTLKQEPHSPCHYPCDPVRNRDYDRSPGSTRESFKQYWEALEKADRDLPSYKFSLNVYYKNANLKDHTFVNTLSALDIKNFSIHAPVTQTMENYGPFDDYAHNHINQPHIVIDSTFANDGNAKINQWLTDYHKPYATIPNRSHKRVSMASMPSARSEWLVRGTNFIYWSAVPNATHYEVLRRSSTGRYSRLKTTTNTLTTVNVSSNTSIAVRACNSHQCGYSAFTTAYFRPNVQPY